MTAPVPYKDTMNRPPIELVGATSDTVATGGTPPGPSGGVGGLVLIGAEWGNGEDAATVIANERWNLPRVPFPLSMERWEVAAYDASGDPISISCVIDVQVVDFATNSFASIVGTTEKPSLSGEQLHDSTALSGWTVDHATDTMYRFELVSFSGAPAKIVLGIRCHTP